MKITIAFYKSKYGNWLDHLISFISRGPFSHVELILDGSLSFSSSPIKDGVAFRHAEIKDSGETNKNNDQITFIKERWEFIDLDISFCQYDKIYGFCQDQIGKKYDWLGAISCAFPIVRGDKQRWFCSEIIIAALHKAGLMTDIKTNISPSAMYKQIHAKAQAHK